MASSQYVIVGGGLAGCVVASRLHEAHPSKSIILLDAGPDEHANPIITSPMGAFALHKTEFEYNYVCAPQKGLDGRRPDTYGGKVLSGGSAVNYGLWTRADAADYDDWAEAVGDERWSYAGQLPYFQKTEHCHNPQLDPKQHGFEGPIHTVAAMSRGYPLRELVRDAFVSTGAKEIPDANNGHPLGLAPYCENWRDGTRQPAGKAYSLDGVQIITRAIAKRVIFENVEGSPKAVGVELTDGRKFEAKQEIILSCGTWRTPQLLKLSGVGPKDELQRHGIPQVLEHPEVGQNLHDHVVFAQFFKVRNPENGLCAGSPAFSKPQWLEGAPMDYMYGGSAPSEAVKQALKQDGATNVDSHPLLTPGRSQYEAVICYAGAPALAPEFSVPTDGSSLTTLVALLNKTSRGSVTLETTNVHDDPILNPNYLTTEVDRTILREGARRMMEVVESRSGKEMLDGTEVVPDGHKPLNTSSSNSEFDARIRRSAVGWWNAVGTSSMGKVVDTELRVKRTQRLRIVDASVIPVPLAAHYQASVYALAEQAADIIAKAAL